MVPANTCRIRVGRLMEIDVAAGYSSVADVDEMIAKSNEQFATLLPQQLAIVAADWRACRLFTPEVADGALRLLAGVIPRVERSAILHRADQPISILQVMRLAKESNHPNRRVFTEPAPMEAWLGEVLELDERYRLRAFLAQRAY